MVEVQRTFACAMLVLASALSRAPCAQAQAAEVRLGGLVFSEYEYLLSDTASHTGGFNVTRAYLNVLGSFEHQISGRVTVDIYRNPESSLAYRLKYAFVQWRPQSLPIAPKFGVIPTPWIEFEEALWGFRMQGPIAADRAGVLIPSDIGAALDFAFGEQRLNGSAALVNGEGYNARPDNRHLDVAARASWRLLKSDVDGPVGGLRASAFGQRGRRADDGRRDRVLAMLSYRTRALTIAGEYGAAWSGVPGEGAADSALTARFGTVFAVVPLATSAFTAIARADVFDPDRDTRRDGLTRVIAGLAYRLSANVRVLADVEHTDYEGEAPTPALEASRTRALFQTELSF